MSSSQDAPKTDSAESLRLRRLAEYRVVGTPPEPDFDRLAELAADLFSVPIALVTFVGQDGVWAKARVGLAAGRAAAGARILQRGDPDRSRVGRARHPGRSPLPGGGAGRRAVRHPVLRRRSDRRAARRPVRHGLRHGAAAARGLDGAPERALGATGTPRRRPARKPPAGARLGPRAAQDRGRERAGHAGRPGRGERPRRPGQRHRRAFAGRIRTGAVARPGRDPDRGGAAASGRRRQASLRQDGDDRPRGAGRRTEIRGRHLRRRDPEASRGATAGASVAPRRAHGSAQPGQFQRGAPGRDGARTEGRRPVHRSRPLQGRERYARPQDRRRGAADRRATPAPLPSRHGRAGASRRR